MQIQDGVVIVPTPGRPSAVPAELMVPAKVVTTPVAMTILRMTELPVSHTYRLVPVESTQIPEACVKLNLAAAPVPFAVLSEFTNPAIVVIAPLTSIFRTTKPFSIHKQFPSESGHRL